MMFVYVTILSSVSSFVCDKCTNYQINSIRIYFNYAYKWRNEIELSKLQTNEIRYILLPARHHLKKRR